MLPSLTWDELIEACRALAEDTSRPNADFFAKLGPALETYKQEREKLLSQLDTRRMLHHHHRSCAKSQRRELVKCRETAAASEREKERMRAERDEALARATSAEGRVTELVELVASAAPLTWVNHRDEEAAQAWEKAAVTAMKGDLHG